MFDANVGVGNRHDRRYPHEDADGLLSEMSRHGVDRALVYHVQGEYISPTRGNERLARWTEAGEGLVPQYVAGSDSGSMSQLEDFRRDGLLTSVRLHHTIESNQPFARWVYGDLLDWLSSNGIPLWISLADTHPSEIVDTLKPYGELTTVLLGATYRHATIVGPILKALANAHLELSRYEAVCGFEKLAAEWGAERLIYGSFFPGYAMGPMLFGLHRSALGERDLKAICGENVENILGVG